MGRDPDAIRAGVEQTRERMGDTVDALAHKADVKTRAKESVTGKVDDLKAKVGGATPSTGEVKQGVRRAAGMAQENPIGLALGSVALGFVAGMLVPPSRPLGRADASTPSRPRRRPARRRSRRARTCVGKRSPCLGPAFGGRRARPWHIVPSTWRRRPTSAPPTRIANAWPPRCARTARPAG
jgi:hypothetical protein